MPNMLISCTFTAAAMLVPLLLLKNTVDGFLCAEFRIVVFSKVFNILRDFGTLPIAHVSPEQKRQQHVEEQENTFEMVQRSPTISTRRLSTRLDVSQTRVWRTLHEDGLYPVQSQRVQYPNPGDSAMHLEFCHWLHTNRQSLPLIIFSD
jgi:hypothetical protein